VSQLLPAEPEGLLGGAGHGKIGPGGGAGVAHVAEGLERLPVPELQPLEAIELPGEQHDLLLRAGEPLVQALGGSGEDERAGEGERRLPQGPPKFA
jgi:hypothetical protein